MARVSIEPALASTLSLAGQYSEKTGSNLVKIAQVQQLISSPRRPA